jgi:ribosomal protein L32
MSDGVSRLEWNFGCISTSQEEERGRQGRTSERRKEKKRKEKKRKFSLEADEVCSYTHFAHRFAIVIGC